MPNSHDGGAVKSTITIQRAGFGKEPWAEHIEAEVSGVFAIHRTPGLMVGDDEWTLTHVPTGFAYLSSVTKADAESALREIQASNLDWATISKPKDLTLAHKAQGKAMRAKYKSLS